MYPFLEAFEPPLGALGTPVVGWGVAAGGRGEGSDGETGSGPCGGADGEGGAELGQCEADPRGEEGFGGAEDCVNALSGARERVVGAVDEGSCGEYAGAGGDADGGRDVEER